MKQRFFAVTLLVAITTAACGQSMKQPDIQFNPHPKMRYEITLTIEGAPATFDVVEMTADYVVKNDRCVPLTPGSGATLAPEHHAPLALTRIGDNVYKGQFYADLLKDDDYYGLGVCQWGLTFVNAGLGIGNVVFGPFVPGEDVLAGRPGVRYFSKHLFTDDEAKARRSDRPLIADGKADRSGFKDAVNSTFLTRMVTEEKFQ